MSKYISEIIKDIKTNPKTWKRYKDNGLQKGNVIISSCGNGHRLLFAWATSVADVTINGKETWAHTTWIDKYRIEETYIWWMKNATLEMMSA